MMRRVHCVALLLVGVWACRSTPDAPPTCYPVRGKVLLSDGTPLRGGRVTFSPKKAGKIAVGELGADGKFTLTSFRRDDGALPGDYIVTVVPVTYKTGSPVPVPQANLVPKRFQEEHRSTLAVTVKSEENDLTLTLR